jgi:hypothetical protein
MAGFTLKVAQRRRQRELLYFVIYGQKQYLTKQRIYHHKIILRILFYFFLDSRKPHPPKSVFFELR